MVKDNMEGAKEMNRGFSNLYPLTEYFQFFCEWWNGHSACYLDVIIS